MLIKPEIAKCFKHYCATGFLLLFFTSIIYTQPPDFDFQEINPEDGLTANEYNWYLYKDSRGLVWISSDDGLYRYDGLDIQPFQAKPGKENTIYDGNIQSDFFEDNNGDLWFSTFEAINCYRRSKDAFESFQVDYDSVTITSGYRVFHLEPNSGKLWLKADSLLFWFQINSNPTQPEYDIISDSSTQGIYFVVDTFSTGEVEQIYSFLYAKPGIDIFSLENDKDWIVERLFTEDSLSQSPALKVYNGIIQNDDSLWLFSQHGLIPFNRNLNQLEDSIIPKIEPNLIFLKGIFLDKKRLLLTSKSSGLWLFDTQSHEFKVFQKHSDNSQNGLSQTKIDAIYLDNQERLWTSHKGKGVRHTPEASSIQKFRNPMKKYYDPPPETSFILENDGNIWIASNNHGVDIFSQGGNRIRKDTFAPGDSTRFQIDVLRDFSLDKTGKVWCLSVNDIYSFANDQWKLAFRSNDHRLSQFFQASISRQLVITSDGVYDLVNDGEKFYLKESKESFFKKKEEFSFIKFFEGLKGGILIPYQDKELWIGKINEKDSIEIVDTIPLSALIYSVSVNENKRITWLGTSEGLAKLDSNNIVTFPLQEQDKLGTSNVYGVLEADNGTLILSTKKGLYVYDPSNKEKKPLLYRLEDGLSSENFSQYAALKASNGKMWFGNSKGLTVFHPDSIAPYPYTPNPYIMELLVDNVPYQGDTVIGEVHRIELDHRSNRLAFEMKAIGYHFPELNTLKYRLIGYDDEWVSIENGQNAVFTKVPYSEKEYVFEYKAFNLNGVESETKTLRINIEPPLIRKSWFQALLFIIAVSLIYAYYRYRIAQIRKEAAYKQMIAETETAVLRLQMNPHFIFNSMNSISSYILQKDINTANDYLGRFARLMRMILDFAAKPLIEVTDEVELLTLYLQTESMRFEGRFDFTIDYREEFDPDEFLIPPMVLQPFVENAILHGFTGKKEQGQIKIRFWEENNSLLCSVEDNGIGRAAAGKHNVKAKTHESKALEITKRRMELLEQKDGVVSSIEFIDLLGANNTPLGTKVLLCFPIL